MRNLHQRSENRQPSLPHRRRQLGQAVHRDPDSADLREARGRGGQRSAGGRAHRLSREQAEATREDDAFAPFPQDGVISATSHRNPASINKGFFFYVKYSEVPEAIERLKEPKYTKIQLILAEF
ncbi:MAG: hypothetical protein COU51_01125 [Parcubacteria group bacterium CG10_big_fil_rev_8_21_14_0_10_36_14]|nr:MAG: hypothetical protein COU51_01125 [Parcubacteria group bacterium CG10_big_fil_rev_8_21_14_0_10_36_14]